MSVVKYAAESEIDFKEPLAFNEEFNRRFSSATSHSQFPSNALPPINVIPTFGLMGSTGIVISVAAFLLNIISDITLIFALAKHNAERSYNYYDRSNHNYPFTVTLILAVIPLVIINAISLTWYLRNKQLSGEEAVFYRKSICGKVTCIMLHIFLLGPLVRYYDTLTYGRTTRRFVVEIDLGHKGSVQHLTPVGEANSVIHQEISRDTAIVDILWNFFKDVPQILFQLFLLNRMYYATAGNSSSYHWTLTTQTVKILVTLFSASWALVSFQDELRRKEPGKMQLPCSATSVCLLWRAGTISSRVIAMAAFVSLKVDSEGGLVKTYDEYDKSVILFPLIMIFIIIVHWGIMVIWIYSQKTTFCSRDDGVRRPCYELLYDLVMGWVHVFDYVNIKDIPSRRRMIFLYLVIAVENTIFILIWYLQVITMEVWIRVLIIFGVESLFIIGICSAIGYYSFLHPDNTKVRQINATWRR